MAELAKACRAVAHLCAQFYKDEWVGGTGGGVCLRSVAVPLEADLQSDERWKQHSSKPIVMAPSGVHKERLLANDVFFLVDGETGAAEKCPVSALTEAETALAKTNPDHLLLEKLSPGPAPRVSECKEIFLRIMRHRRVHAVIHTHHFSTIQENKCYVGGLEMIKGLRGGSFVMIGEVPQVDNVCREADLVDAIDACLELKSPVPCILVRHHGAYIWGRNALEAKRHAEVLHFLLENHERAMNRVMRGAGGCAHDETIKPKFDWIEHVAAYPLPAGSPPLPKGKIALARDGFVPLDQDPGFDLVQYLEACGRFECARVARENLRNTETAGRNEEIKGKGNGKVVGVRVPADSWEGRGGFLGGMPKGKGKGKGKRSKAEAMETSVFAAAPKGPWE